MKLQVLIQKDEDGFYLISCPALHGCHTFGKTYKEALHNIKEAIELYIEEFAESEKKEISYYPKIIATEEVTINA